MEKNKNIGIWVHWIMYEYVNEVINRNKFCKGMEWHRTTSEQAAKEVWEVTTKKHFKHLSPIITFFELD